MNPIDNSIGIKNRAPDAATDNSVARTPEPRTDAAAKDAGKAAEGESVTITRTASELVRLEASLRDAPGIDQARVDAIRRAIDEGSYTVDPQRIVDNLLRREEETSRA
ncbi:MAG: flagellar biosynthesis anti-sigma factor FlgM [Chromatocurvus sp.]